MTRYREWFGVRFEFLLYDVTSTYFEGGAQAVDKAKRGYSRDHRPDCKQLVIALVVRSPGSELSEADLIAYVKTRLAGYKCPKRIEFRDSLARTATGKLQKFKLREPYWEGHERKVN